MQPYSMARKQFRLLPVSLLLLSVCATAGNEKLARFCTALAWQKPQQCIARTLRIVYSGNASSPNSRKYIPYEDTISQLKIRTVPAPAAHGAARLDRFRCEAPGRRRTPCATCRAPFEWRLRLQHPHISKAWVAVGGRRKSQFLPLKGKLEVRALGLVTGAEA